jgi:hypothetical protein
MTEVHVERLSQHCGHDMTLDDSCAAAFQGFATVLRRERRWTSISPIAEAHARPEAVEIAVGVRDMGCGRRGILTGLSARSSRPQTARRATFIALTPAGCRSCRAQGGDAQLTRC